MLLCKLCAKCHAVCGKEGHWTTSSCMALERTKLLQKPRWAASQSHGSIQGGEEFSTGKFLPRKIPPGKNSATIVKSDGKNCATLFHGEGQGLRSALLTEGDAT